VESGSRQENASETEERFRAKWNPVRVKKTRQKLKSVFERSGIRFALRKRVRNRRAFSSVEFHASGFDPAALSTSSERVGKKACQITSRIARCFEVFFWNRLVLNTALPSCPPANSFSLCGDKTQCDS
jgi:hypothetical protein